MVISALNRGDRECAEQYLRDWASRRPEQSVHIKKFVPGDHYHVLGRKFDSFGEASTFLASEGYKCLGLDEIHVYTNLGD